MTVADGEAAIGENILEVQSFGPCAELRPISTTEIGFLVVDGEIALIESSALTTDAGIGMAATEAEIRSAYASDRIAATENRFAIHQVLVRPAGDDGHAILFLFEPGGSTVDRVKAGSYPAIVDYDEGCA